MAIKVDINKFIEVEGVKYYPVMGLEIHAEMKTKTLWRAKVVRKNIHSIEPKASFPKEWAGKTGEDLEKASGVSGATFCHNALFTMSAKTKEAALTMSKIALQ